MRSSLRLSGLLALVCVIASWQGACGGDDASIFVLLYDWRFLEPRTRESILRLRDGYEAFWDGLLQRAADVTLKERRPLVVVPRETPYTRATLQHLLTLHDDLVQITAASMGVPDEMAEFERDLAGLHDRGLRTASIATALVDSLRAEGLMPPGRADRVFVDTRKIHLFDPSTGENLTRAVVA